MMDEDSNPPTANRQPPTANRSIVLRLAVIPFPFALLILGFCVLRPCQGRPSSLRSGVFRWALIPGFVAVVVLISGMAIAADVDRLKASGGQPTDANSVSKAGILVETQTPILREETNRILAALARAAEVADRSGSHRGGGGLKGRKTVVLRIRGNADSQGQTAFEDALRIARAMGKPSLRRVKIVVWIDGEIRDDAALLVIAADQILVSSSAVVTSVDHSGDELIPLNYQSLAKRSGIIPPSVALAWADPAVELSLVTGTNGKRTFAAGDELSMLRRQGKIAQEETWATPADPLRLDADRLRTAQFAAAIVDSIDEASSWLDLATLEPLDQTEAFANPVGVRIDVTGSIAPNRVRRWLSNLSAISEDTNMYFVTFDSSGGNVNSTASLAATFVDPQPPITRTAGVITGATRGDSALAALACDPLYMVPDARLGGEGADTFQTKGLRDHEELIDLIAQRTGRSSGLIRGILDGSREVHRYTHIRTGRIAYATDEEIKAESVDGAQNWQREVEIDLASGISSEQALSLGLIDGIVETTDAAAAKVGLSEIPRQAGDRTLVRWIESFGANPMLTFLLLVIGFSSLSAEMNAPGLGFPGFIALVCFGLFFWIKFLSGTAEWFELVALTLGLICIGIELFVVPGVGIFGVGGLVLTVLGIVLMSQTFVLPQNDFQLSILSRSVWTALGGLLALVIAFLGFRMFLPHMPLFRSLVMESRSAEILDQTERLGDYGHLLLQVGIAKTPLRPSGKASFGNDLVQVISDGSMIEKGCKVRVIEVHATRVIVEPVDPQ